MNDLVLEALWKKVVDDWENDSAHGAFLEHCQQTEQLVEAASRYRGMTGDRERGPSAQKRLKGVAILAMATLESSRGAKSAPRRRGALVLSLLFVAGTVLLLIWINR